MAGWLVVAFCVFLTSLADVGQSRLTITSSTPSGSVMPSGERFDLSCSSSQPWFLCIWEGPMGLACQCQSQEGGVRQMCQGDSRIYLSGSTTTCSMTISTVTVEDIGSYRCVLMDRSIQRVATTMDMTVGIKASLSWASMTNNKEIRREKTRKSTTVVTSGENLMMACRANDGYPESELTLSSSATLDLMEKEVFPSSSAPGINVLLPFSYEGADEDTGGRLVCTSIQRDISGSVLYTSTIETMLQVLPVPLILVEQTFPTPTDLIGIIIGVIVIVLLFLAFLAYFICCKSKKS